MRIADVILFHDELDLLAVRLAEHYDFVERFYLVEAPRTFRYEPKPLYFADHRAEFAAWQDKIEYVLFDADRWFAPDDSVGNERRQRGFLSQYCRADLSVYDFLLQLDADEIIDRRHFSAVLDLMAAGHAAIAPVLRLFFYFLNAELEHPWAATRIFRLADTEVADVSVAHGGVPTRDVVGWHFSFLGPPAQIRRKIKSSSQVEYDLPEFSDERRIAQRMKTLQQPFGPDSVYARYGTIERRSPGDWLPIYVQQHSEKYARYLVEAGVAELPDGISPEAAEVDPIVRQLARRVRDQEVALHKVAQWATAQSAATADRDAEIRRLQGVLEEAVAIRDAEIRRLQNVLEEAVAVRDAEIRRLQGVLAEGIPV